MPRKASETLENVRLARKGRGVSLTALLLVVGIVSSLAVVGAYAAAIYGANGLSQQAQGNVNINGVPDPNLPTNPTTGLSYNSIGACAPTATFDPANGSTGTMLVAAPNNLSNGCAVGDLVEAITWTMPTSVSTETVTFTVTTQWVDGSGLSQGAFPETSVGTVTFVGQNIAPDTTLSLIIDYGATPLSIATCSVTFN